MIQKSCNWCIFVYSLYLRTLKMLCVICVRDEYLSFLLSEEKSWKMKDFRQVVNFSSVCRRSRGLTCGSNCFVPYTDSVASVPEVCQFRGRRTDKILQSLLSSCCYLELTRVVMCGKRSLFLERLVRGTMPAACCWWSVRWAVPAVSGDVKTRWKAFHVIVRGQWWIYAVIPSCMKYSWWQCCCLETLVWPI